MRGLIVHVFSCLSVVLFACQASPPLRARSVHVTVSDEEGQPLFDVPVAIDGLWVTRTTSEGTAELSLAAEGPARASIGVRCAAAHRELSPRSIPRSSAGGTAKLELSFVCRPRLRKLAIVIRAPGGEGLSVRADGEPIGAVAADGTFHATLYRMPDSELRVTIDTADQPLTPRQPERVVRVPDRDELVMLDQVMRRLPSGRLASVRRAKLRVSTREPSGEAEDPEARERSGAP